MPGDDIPAVLKRTYRRILLIVIRVRRTDVELFAGLGRKTGRLRRSGTCCRCRCRRCRCAARRRILGGQCRGGILLRRDHR